MRKARNPHIWLARVTPSTAFLILESALARRRPSAAARRLGSPARAFSPFRRTDILGNQPCIFGPGFEAPPVITATTKLMSIKRTNNTNPRFGDMGVWEIMAAYAKPA